MWYVATGGEVYGPVGVSAIREWAAQGRLQAGWQVRPPEGDVWLSPAGVPELADIFATPPPPPPADGAHLGLAVEDPAPPIGDVLSRAWQLWQQNIGWGAGITVVQILLVLVPMALPALALLLKPWNAWPDEPFDPRWLVPVACGVVYMVLYGPVWLGVQTCFIDGVRTGRPGYEPLFSGFRQWGSVFVLNLVWTLLSCIPYVGYLVIFALPIYTGIELILADRQRGLVDAARQVGPLLSRRYWWVLVLVLVGGLVVTAGVMLCGIGLLIAVPIYGFLTAIIYLHLAERLGWTAANREPPTGTRLMCEFLPMLLVTLLLLGGVVGTYVVMF